MATKIAVERNAQEYPELIGKPVGILTTTMFYTGKLVRVLPSDFVIVGADWVGETGVWADFAANLQAAESSSFPPQTEVYVSRRQCVIIFAADEKIVQAAKVTKRITGSSK